MSRNTLHLRSAQIMCGLNGIFAYHYASSPPRESELLATRDAMRARGPDGAGIWWSEDRRCALGHRRLAILDLSERASQPMVSDDGRLAVVFNGEIYNYPTLRQGSRGRTEYAFARPPTRRCCFTSTRATASRWCTMLRGMFAFAIWDE